MTTPDWWPFLLLAGAAFRTWRLLAKDTILDRPRGWLVGLGNWPEEPVPAGYRERLAEFLLCAWCLGWWVTLGWWVCWELWPTGTTVAAVPFALSAVVGLAAHLDPDE